MLSASERPLEACMGSFCVWNPNCHPQECARVAGPTTDGRFPAASQDRGLYKATAEGRNLVECVEALIAYGIVGDAGVRSGTSESKSDNENNLVG